MGAASFCAAGGMVLRGRCRTKRLSVILRSRCSTWRTLVSFCVACAALGAPSTQLHLHHIIRHTIINTTPSPQHHQHHIINTTSSTHYHLHNTIYTIPSTQHHPHNTIEHGGGACNRPAGLIVFSSSFSFSHTQTMCFCAFSSASTTS